MTPGRKWYLGALQSSVIINSLLFCQSVQIIQIGKSLTHFMPQISFDSPWKYKKRQRLFDVFKRYWKRSVAWNGLTRSHTKSMPFQEVFTFYGYQGRLYEKEIELNLWSIFYFNRDSSFSTYAKFSEKLTLFHP